MTIFDLAVSSVRELNQALHDAATGSFVVDNPRGAHAVAVGIDARAGRVAVKGWAADGGIDAHDLAPTEAVLSEHGNMSSVTVLFVLDEILRRHRPAAGTRGLLGAFGPGFAAELALVEFR